MARFPVVVLLVLAGCKSTLESADQAYMRQDWDAAAAQYDRALGEAKDPASAEHIRSQRDDSRARAAAEHVAKSRFREAAGDLDGAFAEAQAAVRTGESPEAAARLAELRPRVAEAKLESGRAALAAGRVDEAVGLLQGSVQANRSPEAEQLLASARSTSERNHSEAAAIAAAAGDEAMGRDEWSHAIDRYQEANRNIPGTREKEEQFCRAMADGERAGESGQVAQASACFQRALASGIRPDVVHDRVHKYVPARYVVTVHGAAILPFKPGSFRPWDGTSTGALPGAGKLLVKIAGMSGPQGFAMEKFSQLVADSSMAGIEPPDCYVTITVDRQVFGGKATKNQDDLTPVWNVGFEAVARPGDGRVVQVVVADADLVDDDNVGTWQTTVGELVATEGPRTISLISPDGSLLAGGIVALQVSVERR